MATEAVHKYLKLQNRPYSANDIAANLHKEFGKAAIQKALDQLVHDAKIKEKVYGKQKVYCVIQEQESNTEQTQEEMQGMEEKIGTLQQSLNKNDEQIKSLESELKGYKSSLTTEEARIEKERLTIELDKLEEKLKVLSENAALISPLSKKKTEEEHEKYMKQYRKRKRICMEVINSILEGYPKKKKDLLEEVGLETDEDVGCKLLNK